MTRIFRSCTLALCLTVPLAWAAAPLSVNAWARASIAGVNNLAVYGKFANESDRPVAIVSVSSPVARRGMIHKTEVKDGMVSMVPMKSLAVPSGQTVECGPGKCHIMLMGVKHALKPGDTFKLTLGFEGGQSQTVDVKVGAISQMTAP